MGNINLAGRNWLNVKKLSKEESGLVNEEIAAELEVDPEVVSRHFREAKYNITPALMSKLCRILGNDYQIEWLCIDAGGHFSKVDATRREDLSIDMQIARLHKEFADVMTADAKAMLDGDRNPEEKMKIIGEVNNLIRKAQEVIFALEAPKGKA